MINVGEYQVILTFRVMYEDKYFFDLWISKVGEKSIREEIRYDKSKSEIETFNHDSIINEEFLLKEIVKFIKEKY